MSGENCSWDLLHSVSDQCAFVKDNCFFSYFSLLNFNYCVINDHSWVTFILLILIIVLCFYFLSTTGNVYLAPALGIISEKLNLSQNLAGITLLALTNILLDMIVTAKLLLPTNIPKSFLSMTILAGGNSLPDFIVNSSLAKKGYAEMALSGSIGAPVFGLLMGFGLSLSRRLLIKNYVKKQDSFQTFELFNYNDNLNKKLLTDAFICIFTMLLILSIMGFAIKFKIGRTVSIFGYSIYAFFFISIIFLTFFS